jgi:hypothetical protein
LYAARQLAGYIKNRAEVERVGCEIDAAFFIENLRHGVRKFFGVALAKNDAGRLELVEDEQEPYAGYLDEWHEQRAKAHLAVTEMLAKRKKMSGRHEIGVVAVDSGQLMLTDPCYVDGSWNPDTDAPDDWGMNAEQPDEFSYHGACCQTLSEKLGGQLNFPDGIKGAGVAVSTGWGDGIYPVFAIYNEEGRVVKVEIEFTPFGLMEGDA